MKRGRKERSFDNVPVLRGIRNKGNISSPGRFVIIINDDS